MHVLGAKTFPSPVKEISTGQFFSECKRIEVYRPQFDPQSTTETCLIETKQAQGGKGCEQPRILNPTTSFLTATALAYAIGAGITAAAGTRLALQLILTDVFKYHSLQAPHYVVGQSCYFSSLPLKCLNWAICAPAANLSRGSRLSGSLSGIEP